MAIIAKRITNQNSGNFISATTGTIAAADLQYITYEEDGITIKETFQHTLTKIEEVYVLSGTVTIAGLSFGPGKWDLSKIGGLPITPATSFTVPANTIIRLR